MDLWRGDDHGGRRRSRPRPRRCRRSATGWVPGDDGAGGVGSSAAHGSWAAPWWPPPGGRVLRRMGRSRRLQGRSEGPQTLPGRRARCPVRGPAAASAGGPAGRSRDAGRIRCRGGRSDAEEGAGHRHHRGRGGRPARGDQQELGAAPHDVRRTRPGWPRSACSCCRAEADSVAARVGRRIRSPRLVPPTRSRQYGRAADRSR